MLEMGEEIEEYYNEFEKQFLQFCTQVFELGQKHYKIRTEEIDQFLRSVEESQKENQQEGIQFMEKFLEKKAEIFNDVNQLQNRFSNDEIDQEKYNFKIKQYTEMYDQVIHQTWKDLMKLELILFEQMEDVIQNFEHVISEYKSHIL